MSWVDSWKKWALGISWWVVLGLVGGIIYNLLVPPRNYPAAGNMFAILLATLLPTPVSVDKIKALISLVLSSYFPPAPPTPPAPSV